jgi:hypothetical protein
MSAIVIEHVKVSELPEDWLHACMLPQMRA